MDIRYPPIAKDTTNTAELAQWAQQLSSWLFEFYEWMKFPHFHQLALIDATTYTANVTLADKDMCKLIKIDSAGAVVVTLPSATAARVGYYVCIERTGTGSLRVTASGSDTIGESSAGGYVLSDEVRSYPRISLHVAEAGAWTFGLPGSYGIWEVY